MAFFMEQTWPWKRSPGKHRYRREWKGRSA
nr:MAG TPA_asm: hypothetical protein [Bacteriophage sp.]